MDEQPEKRRRKLRLFLILGLTGMATAVIGYGGLAAWNVATANNGNTFTAGRVEHTNSANGGAACDSGLTTGPVVCSVIWNKTGAKPGDSTSGTVTITSTGDLNSTFALASTSISGGLCADINLTVTDGEALPATLYTGALSAWAAASAPKADNGHSTWLTGDAGTYTFTLTLSAGAPQTDMGLSCATNLRFTQTAA